jgi:hypothetical protein
VISLDDLAHLVLGVIGGPMAHALGQGRRGQARFDSQTQLQGMDGATAAPTRFVEPTPKSHRTKERVHLVRVLAAAAIETPLKHHPGWGLVVGFGFELIEGPGHDPSSNLMKQPAECTFKRHGRCRRWFRLDKPLKEPGALGE